MTLHGPYHVVELSTTTNADPAEDTALSKAASLSMSTTCMDKPLFCLVVLMGARLVVPRNVVENTIVLDNTARTKTWENLCMVIVYSDKLIIKGCSVVKLKILGMYPDDLSDEGMQSVGRGRIMPSTPWDACYQGIARWLGIGMEEMDEVY